MSLRHDMISSTVEVEEGQQTWQDHVREPLLPSGLNQVGSETDRQEVDLESSSNNMLNKNTKEEESLDVSHSNNFEMARHEGARSLSTHRCASMSIATSISTPSSAALVSIILGFFCISYGYAYCTSLVRETYETKRDRDNDSFYESVSLMKIMGLNFVCFGFHILYTGLLHYILKVNNSSSSSPIAMNEYNMSNEVDEANDANDVCVDAVDGTNSITIECSSPEYTWVSLWRITKGYGMYTLICIIIWMPITLATLSIANAGYGNIYIIVIGSFVVGALMADKLFRGNEAVRLVPVVPLVRSR